MVLGVAYKPDVGDIRESPAIRVMNGLIRRGAHVTWHDPLVAELPGDAGQPPPRTELSQRTLRAADCLALLTPHRSYDVAWIAEHAPMVFDARNAFGATPPPNVVTL